MPKSNDSLRGFNVEPNERLSSQKHNDMLRRIANMSLEKAPGRRTASGGGTSLTLETTVSGITATVSAGNVFWHDQIIAVEETEVSCDSDTIIWLSLDDEFEPTACTINNGSELPEQNTPPNVMHFKLAEITSDGTTATVEKTWNGGDIVWPAPFAFYA